MANFKMHLGVAAGGSGFLATLCLGAELAVSGHEVAVFAVLGTVGGILPDIDLDHAAPTKLMFTVLGIIAAFAVLLAKASDYAVLELWLAWVGTYAAVRYPLWEWFNRFTAHRGVFHTLVAALFFWFLVTTLTYYLTRSGAFFAWMCGFFVFLGYLIHLSLDEVYSVDFMNKRLKNSFGTALKIINPRDIPSSLIMVAVAVLAFFMAPPGNEFIQRLLSAHTYQTLAGNLLPQGMWFNL